MTEQALIVEQSEDGTWGAYTLSPSLIAGMGGTKEEAIADWTEAMGFWLEWMIEKDSPEPGSA